MIYQLKMYYLKFGAKVNQLFISESDKIIFQKGIFGKQPDLLKYQINPNQQKRLRLRKTQEFQRLTLPN